MAKYASIWCGVQLRNWCIWGRHFCLLLCETFFFLRLGGVCLRGLSFLGVQFLLGGRVAVPWLFLSVLVFLVFLWVIEFWVSQYVSIILGLYFQAPIEPPLPSMVYSHANAAIYCTYGYPTHSTRDS
jgi:hypothetical protein